MPEDYSLYAVPSIKIDGAEVSSEFLEDLEEVVVNTDVHYPGMFTLRLADPQFTWSGGATLALGKAVEISMQPREQGNESGSKTVIFKGEITALEPEFGDGKAWMVVRGYDKGHRLHRGKKTRTFVDKKDSDLVSTIAGEVGLSAQVDATSVSYKYILQNNQTNMEFLQERARRIGYWVYVDSVNGKLCFEKAATLDGSSVATLKWGEELKSFAPRVSSAHQANTVKVYGWDNKAKAALTADATPAVPTQGGQTQAGGAAAQSAFGDSAEAVVVSEPLVSVDEATAMATGLGEQISRSYVSAEGRCTGNPKIVAGKVITIEIKGGSSQTANTKFGGNYLVTSANHMYDGTEYWIEFSITGLDPYTFSSLLGADPPAAALTPGVVTALVTNVKDPDKLGRVKVKFPWMGPNPEIESDWIRISTPMAGAERGFMALPEVNDEVLVAFERGNPDFPFMVGGLWSNTDKPPVASDVAADSGGKIVQRIFKSRAGHTILLDDTQGSELVKILTKGGNIFLMQDASGSELISLESKSGHLVKIDEGGKKIQIANKAGTGSVVLDCNTGDITIKGNNITIEAQLNLGLKGSAGAKLEGATVDVKASGAGTFDGGGMATVKGGLVKIN